MKRLILLLLSLLALSCSTTESDVGSVKDRQALEQTSVGIRTAFANSDVETILSYHDTNVSKALG